ncbi:hypothetical protein G6F56_010625 [Rhizopus delemar]|nr:hypothetical protein G6F56_010625 [Rhizopus delemar]
MFDVNKTNTQEQQIPYTQIPVEQLLREFSKRMKIDKQRTDEDVETEFPLEFQENFRKFKREGNKYAQNEWTTGQSINKELLPEFKRHQVDTAQVVNSIYKSTDNNRFQATTAMELYEQIEISEQAKRLAVVGLVTAKTQEQEAKEYSLKALRRPPSLKHQVATPMANSETAKSSLPTTSTTKQINHKLLETSKKPTSNTNSERDHNNYKLEGADKQL